MPLLRNKRRSTDEQVTTNKKKRAGTEDDKTDKNDSQDGVESIDSQDGVESIDIDTEDEDNAHEAALNAPIDPSRENGVELENEGEDSEYEDIFASGRDFLMDDLDWINGDASSEMYSQYREPRGDPEMMTGPVPGRGKKAPSNENRQKSSSLKSPGSSCLLYTSDAADE